MSGWVIIRAGIVQLVIVQLVISFESYIMLMFIRTENDYEIKDEIPADILYL